MQALLHSCQWQIEEGRHLAAGPLADVVERHHLTLARRQRTDGLSDKTGGLGLLRRSTRLHVVGCQALVFHRQRLGDGPAAAQAIAVLEHHGAQPTDERLRMPQRRQLAKCVEKRLLRRVLGKVVVAKQRERIANGHVLKPHDEAVKRAKLTGLRPLHLRRQQFMVNLGWLHRCPDSPFQCTCPAKTHAERKWILAFASRPLGACPFSTAQAPSVPSQRRRALGARASCPRSRRQARMASPSNRCALRPVGLRTAQAGRMPTSVQGRLGLGQEALPQGNGSCGACGA